MVTPSTHNALINTILDADPIQVRAHLALPSDGRRALRLDEPQLRADGWNGSTALHVACGCDAPDEIVLQMVQALLAAGAPCNVHNVEQDVPLTLAIRTNRAAVVEALLHAGADPLLEAPGNPNVLSVTSGRRMTPLHTAAWGAQAHLLKILLDRGAPPHHVDAQERSLPFVLVMGLGEVRTASTVERALDALDVLLAAGADPNRASFDRTPLTRAAAHGQREVVLRLLAAGAHLHHGEVVRFQRRYRLRKTPGEPRENLPTESAGWTALHLAAQRNHPTVVQALLDQGADPSRRCGVGFNGANDPGPTPRDLAVRGDAWAALAVLENHRLRQELDRLPRTPSASRPGRGRL